MASRRAPTRHTLSLFSSTLQDNMVSYLITGANRGIGVSDAKCSSSGHIANNFYFSAVWICSETSRSTAHMKFCSYSESYCVFLK